MFICLSFFPRLAESDGSDTLIPEISSVRSKVTSKSTHSKQKTLFDVVSSKRGRGGGGRGRGGRGRGRGGRGKQATTSRTKDALLVKTEKLSDGEGTSLSKVKEESAEEDVDGENKATAAESTSAETRLKAEDSLGGIAGKVATLKLKTLSCVVPPDVGVSNSTSSSSEAAAPPEGSKVKNDVTGRRGRGRGRKRTVASRQTSGAGISPAGKISHAPSAAASIVADTAALLEEDESPDLLYREDDQSDHTKKSCDNEETESEHSLSTASSTSLDTSQSGRGRKGRGRGGASKRGKASTATPRRKSTETTAKSRKTPPRTDVVLLKHPFTFSLMQFH